MNIKCKNDVCPVCQRDLGPALALLGESQIAIQFHVMLHYQHEVMRLLVALEDLRDGGYGVKEKGEEILRVGIYPLMGGSLHQR